MCKGPVRGEAGWGPQEQLSAQILGYFLSTTGCGSKPNTSNSSKDQCPGFAHRKWSPGTAWHCGHHSTHTHSSNNQEGAPCEEQSKLGAAAKHGFGERRGLASPKHKPNQRGLKSSHQQGCIPAPAPGELVSLSFPVPGGAPHFSLRGPFQVSSSFLLTPSLVSDSISDSWCTLPSLSS